MAEPLKNMVDAEVVRELGCRVAAVAPHFDEVSFGEDLLTVLPRLELKPRIEAIARRLRSGLDGDYLSALAVVVDVARAEPPIGGFAAWPLCTFVEIFGLDHPAESLAAMEHLTKRASCEFAIRPYLRHHWDAAFAALMAYTHHPDESVRRLSSEGSRPRLPWGARVGRLLEDPQPGLTLIERLRRDPSETVRRSVANHLNDVSKDHPRSAVDTVERWAADPAVDRAMLSHALRTLVKRGDPDALRVLGFTIQAEIEVVAFSVDPGTVAMGDRIELAATLRSRTDRPQRLVVDFVIHHVIASGATSPKVFKWTTVNLAGRASVTLAKRRLIQMASTRTYRSGWHRVELKVAGDVVAEGGFDIVV